MLTIIKLINRLASEKNKDFTHQRTPSQSWSPSRRAELPEMQDRAAHRDGLCFPSSFLAPAAFWLARHRTGLLHWPAGRRGARTRWSSSGRRAGPATGARRGAVPVRRACQLLTVVKEADLLLQLELVEERVPVGRPKNGDGEPFPFACSCA